MISDSFDYDDFVESRCKDYVDANYCVVAINGEAGEVAEWWKKYQLRGNPTGKLSEMDLLEGLGDLVFYISRMADLHNWTLMDVMRANIAKLESREASGSRSIDVSRSEEPVR